MAERNSKSDKEQTSLIYSVDRKDVEDCKVGWLVDELMKLSDSKDDSLRWQGRVFLNFEGWEEEERDFFEIPEILNYFKSVNSQWNHWLHFFAPEDGGLGVILYMGLELDFKKTKKGLMFKYKKLERSWEIFVEMMASTRRLHLVHGLDDSYSDEVLSRAGSFVKSRFSP